MVPPKEPPEDAPESHPLSEYAKKRDFQKTPEPPAEVPPSDPAHLVFVVHRHEARRLHYDLRLEMDGVLCSWAVPKGFSYDPADKHLAVRTEDHPMRYEDFSGVIPKGEYGAGTMTIWDRGTYEVVQSPTAPDAMQKGEVKVILRGRRLRGEWHLVKTTQGPKTWLLFKSKDAYAGKARETALGIEVPEKSAHLPACVKRMEPAATREPFSDPAWFFEMRFEGKRVLAEKVGAAVELRGVRQSLPEVEAGLARLGAENALVDGVLVVTDELERPSRALLDARLAGESAAEVSFYAFDLLYADDYDLRALPLTERKQALRTITSKASHVLFVDHVPGNGTQLAEAVAAAGLPGLIAKRAASPYRPGPSQDWLEVTVPADADAAHFTVDEALAKSQPARARSRVKFTNLEKVFWPAEGYTKGDLVAHYERFADVLLPYLRDRPIHMNRFPDGIEGKNFYQRQAKEDAPPWLHKIEIETSDEEPQIQFVCNDHDTLLWLANQGSIDLHPWLSRTQHLESPDWCLIDLDPKGAPFEHVVRVARTVGKVLRGVGLRPYLKTSGKTGLHIVVPLLEGAYTYAHSVMFGEAVARIVAREHADISTVERVIESRGGKVYIDYLQNRQAQTIVPPYSLRPVPGAQVSAPLAWDELEGGIIPAHFTLLTFPERFERVGDLYAGALTDRQDLAPAIEALEKHYL